MQQAVEASRFVRIRVSHFYRLIDSDGGEVWLTRR
jgi:hypothetical protein